MTRVFEKSSTQQKPIAEAAIARVADVMQLGRLQRYNRVAGELGPVAELERAFANWLGVPYALALASGGQALQIALRATGVISGDDVLTNGFTLGLTRQHQRPSQVDMTVDDTQSLIGYLRRMQSSRGCLICGFR